MQVEESAVTRKNTSVNSRNVSATMPIPANSNSNEDAVTNMEMNQESDDEKDAQKSLTSEALSNSRLPTIVNNTDNIPSSEDDDHTTTSKKSNIENSTRQENNSPKNNPLSELPPTSSSTFIGKVTEKPTRFEDLISGHCSNVISDDTSDSITSNRQQSQQDVIREENNKDSEVSSKSVDDTLKLTFYKEGRKELTKEYRPTRIESGGESSPGSDGRYFENRHGLQMSRVVREVEAAVFDRNARIDQQQHSVILTESESKESQDQKSGNAQNFHTHSSNNTGKSDTLSPGAETSSTQSHSGRLISSTDQNYSSNINSPTDSKSRTGNNNSNNDNDKTVNSPHEISWDGLRISRCQKEIVGEVITLEGENSSDAATNTSIIPTTISHPSDKEKGENENSVERHLQTYLTSLRYVKPTESCSGTVADQQDEENGKGKSTILSPPSRPATTRITSPVISPPTRSLGSGSLASGGSSRAIDEVVSIPIRVSPSQHEASSAAESWPERSIARIPTRPYLRRNITYEVNQFQQQHQQQSIISQRQNIRASIPTPAYQQQQRVEEVSLSIPVTQQASVPSAEVPQHSPPKRFKSGVLANTQYAHSHNVIRPHLSPSQFHSHQQPHQNQQTILDRYSSNAVQYQHPNRTASVGIDHNETTHQQHHSSVSTNTVNATRSSGIAYSSSMQQQHYHNNNNPRPSSSAHPYPATGSNVSTIISPQQRSPATQHLKHHTNAYSQQQLEYQKQLQQSLLIASSSLASSSSEPIDSSYEDRLRRYTEIYQRNQLDREKLKEYYDKYHFYPWDILTARDEPIIRQMRSQQQSTNPHVPQSPAQTAHHQTVVRESTTNNMVRYDASRRIEIENAPLQNQQRQYQTKSLNLEHSPTARNLPVPIFSPSHVTTNVSPPNISPQQPTQHIQTRYSHVHQMQQIQHVQHRAEYVVQQQQVHNRYYHHSDQSDQNYRHQTQQNASRAIQSPAVNVPTNRDIQNSPHYRSAYNQLAAAAAAVSSVAAGAATSTNTQNPLRASDVRSAATNANMIPSRDERLAHFMHSRPGAGVKPVVMTVADPVPAPPEAVPLSIHRQALEQAIRSNQAAAVAHSTISNLPVVVNRDDSGHFRHHDQRAHPMSPQSHHHANRQMVSQQSYYEHQHPRNVTIDGRVVTGLGVQSGGSEPLRRVPSPTLAHQTSVIRRIQQPESSPTPMRSPFVTAGLPNRHFIESDRPGISFRRISDGSGTDSIGGSGVGVSSNSSAFLYHLQQQQNKDNNSQASASSHYQHQQLHHHRGNNSLTPRYSSSEMPIHRNLVSIDNGQGTPRATQKRRIIISDNNGINQNHPERCPEVGAPSTANQIESPGRGADMANKGNSTGADCQYDHVVLVDKHNKTYRCKRCFETVKTQQQIRNHLFCKMLANHIQCYVCLQLIASDKYPEHLIKSHGVQPPETI